MATISLSQKKERERERRGKRMTKGKRIGRRPNNARYPTGTLLLFVLRPFGCRYTSPPYFLIIVVIIYSSRYSST